MKNMVVDSLAFSYRTHLSFLLQSNAIHTIYGPTKTWRERAAISLNELFGDTKLLYAQGAIKTGAIMYIKNCSCKWLVTLQRKSNTSFFD